LHKYNKCVIIILISSLKVYIAEVKIMHFMLYLYPGDISIMNESGQTNIPKLPNTMCNIPTNHPDAHVTACLQALEDNVLSTLIVLRSMAEKSILTAHFLQELKAHKMLEKPLASTVELRQKAMVRLRAQVKRWKEKKNQEREKFPGKTKKSVGTHQAPVLEWDIPEEVLESLVNWLLVDLLKK
jgi:hypothetical protein